MKPETIIKIIVGIVIILVIIGVISLMLFPPTEPMVF